MRDEYKVEQNNISNILTSVLAHERITQADLSEKLGYGSRQAVNNKLCRGRLTRIDKLVKFLDAIDYELIIRVKERHYYGQSTQGEG